MGILNFFLSRYDDASFEVRKRAQYLLIMNSITISFMVVAGIIRIIPYPETGALILSWALIKFLITLLIRYGKCNLAGILSVTMIFILSIMLVLQDRTPSLTELFRASIYMATGIFISSLVTYRKRNFFFYGILSIIFLSVFFAYRLHTHYAYASSTLYSSTFVIMVLLLAGITAISYNIFSITRELVNSQENEDRLNREMISQVRKNNVLLEKTVETKTSELNAAVKELTRKNDVMTEELKMAQRVQQNLIPSGRTSLQTSAIDFGSSYRAVYNVGGDLYDIIPINEHKYAFLMADVSGHGIAASLITTMAKVSFRANTVSGKNTAEICDAVDREMYTLIGDLEYYLTAYFCILDASTGMLEFTNCGHHPALRNMRGTLDIDMLDTGGSVLGSFKSGDSHEANTVRLVQGDRIILFTDGIIEARNKDNRFFDIDNLRIAIRRSGKLGAQSFIDSLIQDIDNFCGERTPDDDRAILCIDYNPDT